MDQVQEDLHHQLDQLHVLAAEINDPLAERLVRDLIVELEGRLMAEALNAKFDLPSARRPGSGRKKTSQGTPDAVFALVPLEAALPSFDYSCG